MINIFKIGFFFVLGNLCSGSLIEDLYKDVQSLKQRVKDLEGLTDTLVKGHVKRVNPGSTNIAFDVVLSKDALHAEQDFVLKFDRILTNIGNGYNAAKGIFTAPVSGAYLFSWNIRSGYHASIISKLMVNGRPMQATHTDSSLDTQYGFEAHSSKTVILTINEADQVWIENFPQRGEIHSSIDGGYTGFVGTLLF